jgi:hypothetical protein
MAGKPESPQFHVDALIPAVTEGGERVAIWYGHPDQAGMHPEAVRFDVAAQLGGRPENIRILSRKSRARRGAPKAGRLSVGFAARDWKTDWIPEGDKPTLN